MTKQPDNTNETTFLQRLVFRVIVGATLFQLGHNAGWDKGWNDQKAYTNLAYDELHKAIAEAEKLADGSKQLIEVNRSLRQEISEIKSGGSTTANPNDLSVRSP